MAIYNELLNTELLKQVKYDNQLEKAFINEEFVVFFQPKYYLKNQSLAGAEVLIRWINQDGNIILPDQFIPTFEKNGDIVKLDIYVFEKTCSLMRKWKKEGKKLIPISVNISRLNLINEEFVFKICEIARRYQIPNHFIEIEITESIMLENQQDIEQVVNRLHEAGFQLSMDDFGNGYSSLGLLKNIPVDTIKLDYTFLNKITDNQRARIILNHIIKMAQELAIHVVAEGVELQEQVNLLSELSCDIVQGFYFCKPLHYEEFSYMLNV